jgi:uncharacterized membrane protein
VLLRPLSIGRCGAVRATGRLDSSAAEQDHHSESVSAHEIPRLPERIELQKLDYDHTAKILESLNSNTMTARGAITVTAALVTVAVNRHSWPTAAIAVVVVVLFFALALYNSATFTRAFDHLNHVDNIIRVYYFSLGTSDNSDELARLLNASDRDDVTQFGLKGALSPKWTWKHWLQPALRFQLAAFYGALVILAFFAIVYDVT